MGGGDVEENIAYGTVDLGISAYGLVRHVLKPDSWRLFRYVSTDYVKAYKLASKKVLALEAMADGLTIKSLRTEAKNKKE